MPKRKFTDSDYEKLRKKLRKIEKTVQRSKTSKRRRILSSSSSSSDDSLAGQSERNDCTYTFPVSPVASSLDQDLTGSPAPNAPASSSRDYADACDPAVPRAPSTPEGGAACRPAPAGTGEVDLAVLTTLSQDTSELDADILEILGDDPTRSVNYSKDIQKDVAVRFEHTATNGLSKEDRKELMSKYLVPMNCKLIGAPTLNPEIKAALSEAVIKRDAVIESKQKLTATAIASLGEAITLLLSSKEKNPDLLRLLFDSGRTMCDCLHNDTITRRNFIIFSVKKEMKESLQNAKVDSFLFGQDLCDTLKSAKAIHKSGAELKATHVPKPSTSKNNLANTSKNWKTFNPTRPPTATTTSRAREPTTRSAPAPATRGQRGAYSRRSNPPRAANNRR